MLATPPDLGEAIQGRGSEDVQGWISRAPFLAHEADRVVLNMNMKCNQYFPLVQCVVTHFLEKKKCRIGGFPLQKYFSGVKMSTERTIFSL